jgi:formylglycine-generating enzyme required for sulfatase activity
MHSTKVLGLGLSGLIHPSVLAANLGESPDSRYVAPDAGATTRQADIYSAGVIFYELLTGQTPMGSYLSPSQIRDDLPEKVDGIVNIALDPNAEDRYPTARDMLNDIQRLFQGEEEESAGIPKRTMIILLGGVALISSVLIASVILSDPEKDQQNKDAALRASVVKGNPLPSDETIQSKLAQHPDMVWIPKGSFIHGRMNFDKAGSPTEALAEVKEVPAYYIDRFEWKNQQGGHPTVKVTYEQAKAACEGAGKRLCSNLEWERACKGTESLIYPYGDVFSADKCGPGLPGDSDKNGESDATSGAMDGCKSSFGVFDLAGGPREWTGTTSGDKAIIKGGRKGVETASASRCAFEDSVQSSKSDSSTSFRCCLDDK